MEGPVKIEYRISLSRTIYSNQCWEIDPDRTVLTQYIARHPDSIRATFAGGDIVRIDGIMYVVKDTLSGYFGLDDCEWYVSTICYYLKPLPFSMGLGLETGWTTIPGNIVEPKAIPTVTTGALYNQRLRKKGEVYNLNAELDEARNRFLLVVAELNRIRKKKEEVA